MTIASASDPGHAGGAADCDVAIVGGGMVGASLALALADLPLRVTVVEAVPPEADAQPSFDARTIALSNGTRRIFQGLGVWDEIGRGATPIRRIHVSDRGRFGSARLDAAEQDVPALGYVVENRNVGAALWRHLRAAGRTTLLSPATVTDLATEDGVARLALAGERAGRGTLSARLVVAADGAQSVVRRKANVAAERWDYDQVAVIANVVTERFHDHTAYERFTDTGPIALLPIADGRCVCIWTHAPESARATLALDDASFLARLQECFGWRLGRFLKVGERLSYPLALTRSDALGAPRVAIIGNAAQGLHPIAGQGFNLGLRDAATLAEVIADGLAAAGDRDYRDYRGDSGDSGDPGDPDVLARYAAWRAEDRGALIAFTDGLVRVFGNPLGPIRAARTLGLLAFDVSPFAKAALSKLSLGFAGRLPRLARGLPLVAAEAHR